MFGVSFSCIPTPKPVDALADFTGRSGNVNVLSLNNLGPFADERDWTNVSDGTILATFGPPFRGGSIDAIPGDVQLLAGRGAVHPGDRRGRYRSPAPERP